MKHIYAISFFVISILLCSGCSKDFLKSYDKRIVGTWEITDIDRLSPIGESASSFLNFTNGTFTFYENGNLDYINEDSTLYSGSWDIIRRTVDDNTTQSLQITAVNFEDQTVLSEYYNDIDFRSRDHFVGKSNGAYASYNTHFRR